VATIEEVLGRARDDGFLGPGPVAAHIAHARGYLGCVAEPPEVAADLGSGGGIPALVLALAWPTSRWTLIEASMRRGQHLRWAVEALGLAHRVVVEDERAEVVGRSALRGTCDLVTARSFGPPAVTAECAAPLLRPGGRLVVSEPPDDRERWPEPGLGLLHLGPPALVDGDGARYAVMCLVEPAPERYPRRVGIPAKRPLF
jgi:16S rRNA (guanine527-N7)-methyltransferase